MFASPFDEATEVGLHEGKPLVPASSRARVARAQPRLKLAEKPRIEQGATADRDSSTTCFRKHACGVGERADVAVADDRNSPHCFNNTANAIEFDTAAEALFARPAMHRHRRYADIFEDSREFWSAPRRVIPPQAHFH